MKLKFKADAKDWTIFAIFCVVLLYFVSIAVLNLSYFANYSKLWGLNPFPAFGPQYIIATLVGFIAALIAIVASVSSYFFDRDKGFGISTEAKKEKGYSHWASDKEFRKDLQRVLPGEISSQYAGIPLSNNGKEIWVDAGEYHNLIMGSTGSGKTEILVQPMVKMLAKKGESMIITDPKGEIYEKNAVELKEKGYNVVLLNFRNPQQGNSWNPLTLPYRLYKTGNKDKANELIDDLAANILYDDKAQNQDPFWEKTSADYFAGLTLGLFEDATEDEINLNSINLMTTVGEEKCGPSTYVKEYFSFKDPSSPEYINVSSTLMAPNETKSSILSVFKQKIKLFSSRENLSEMLSHSDFDMNDIGRKKTAVFIVIQDEKKTYHSLVTIFLKQCYETLIDVAQENGGKLQFKTNFILDEFANMPPLKDVTTMVTAARSRAIRFTFIIQNFAQLYQVYGKENGETIKGNCGNIIYLISSELAALEEISKMCGEVKSKEKDKTASTPLITVSDLQRLPKGTIIVLRTRQMPFKTKMMYNWQMERDHLWGKSYDLAGYPQREKGQIQLFNLKKFVDAKKDEKINQMLSSMAGGNGMMPSPAGRPSGRPTPKAPMGGIDVNDFFKKVDQKLAEIEKQEQAEKAAQKDKPIVDNKVIEKPVQSVNHSSVSDGSLSSTEKDMIKSSVMSAINSSKSSNSIQDQVKKAISDEQKKKAEIEKQQELEKKQAEEKRIAQEKKEQEILAFKRQKEEENKKAIEKAEEEKRKALAKAEEEKKKTIEKAELEKKKLQEEQERLLRQQKEHEEEVKRIEKEKEKALHIEAARKAEELKKLAAEKKLQEEKEKAKKIELERIEKERKERMDAENKRIEEQQKKIDDENRRIEQQNKKIEELRLENEKKQKELEKLEERRKNQEKELLDAIKKEEAASKNVVKEEKKVVKKEITEDQFFDDFFNDDDE